LTLQVLISPQKQEHWRGWTCSDLHQLRAGPKHPPVIMAQTWYHSWLWVLGLGLSGWVLVEELQCCCVSQLGRTTAFLCPFWRCLHCSRGFLGAQESWEFSWGETGKWL